MATPLISPYKTKETYGRSIVKTIGYRIIITLSRFHLVNVQKYISWISLREYLRWDHLNWLIWLFGTLNKGIFHIEIAILHFNGIVVNDFYTGDFVFILI